ncbi:helix-turn-helix domain-containing protein [Enterococcus larvae]|uniref:helix-turn-helix domain-containing protein n=1 Tax=Enterococcus larvae TaxID=2794352 RepID=UPI003F34765D
MNKLWYIIERRKIYLDKEEQPLPVNLIDSGYRIKQIRKKHNYSMAAFAKLVGNSSASTVNNWEKGNNLPKADRLEKIAILGSTTTDWIKYGDFKEYIQALLHETAATSSLSEKELEYLSKHLKQKNISYEDDVQILMEVKKEYPQLFEHYYEEGYEDHQEVTALIAEDRPNYLVEKKDNYRNHLLPLINTLSSKPGRLELLAAATVLLVEEDAETISFLTKKLPKI